MLTARVEIQIMGSQSAAARPEQSSQHQWDLIEQTVSKQFIHRIHSFHLRLIDNGLVLEGHTKTYYSKQAVQHAEMAASELPIRANNYCRRLSPATTVEGMNRKANRH